MRILQFRVYATRLKLDLELELWHSDAKACDTDFKPLKGNNSIDDLISRFHFSSF